MIRTTETPTHIHHSYHDYYNYYQLEPVILYTYISIGSPVDRQQMPAAAAAIVWLFRVPRAEEESPYFFPRQTLASPISNNLSLRISRQDLNFNKPTWEKEEMTQTHTNCYSRIEEPERDESDEEEHNNNSCDMLLNIWIVEYRIIRSERIKTTMMMMMKKKEEVDWTEKL